MAEKKYLFPGVHILVSEYACPHCGQLPPDIKTDPFYYESFLIYEDIRIEWGRPIPICKGGGWRCDHYQCQLIRDKKTNAATAPHSFWALDLDVNSKKEVLQLVDIIKAKHPELRKGYKKYLEKGMSFVHIDRMFKIKPKVKWSWTEGYTW